MHNFKTIEETAAKWNVSARYIQALCRQGKIEGAVKRAGVWFIPDTEAGPLKSKKLNGQQYLRFGGTKKKIFETAVSLFAEKSYELVAIKDITDAVGIRQSAMYNHFKSKQEIMDTIYDFYCRYIITDRPSLKDLEPVLRRGSLLDIINSVTYDFNPEYRNLLIDMSKIIFHRRFVDERAKEISKKYTVQEGIEFVEAVFNRAVEIGRLAPLDAHAMAVFCNSVRTFMYHNWIIDPSENQKWLKEEQTLFRYAAALLKDLNPPTDNKSTDAL